MTTSALARRGSKCAAACKHQNPLRPNLTRCRSAFVLPVVPSPITRHADMLCLLAAAAASRATGTSSCTQRRHFNARSSSSSAAISASASSSSSSPTSAVSSTLNDPSQNIFHPRRIGKGCDLNALHDYLQAQGHQLGPERVYKTLRSALYNASGYQADKAWQIYQMMLEHGVSHRMGANHYGHLLNILKYGNNWERMINVLDHMRKQGTQVGPLHYAQVLFTMARHGQLESACKILKEMREAGVPRQPSHLTSLALAIRSHHVSTKQHEVAAKIMMEAMQLEGIVIENRACAVMVSHLSRTSMDKTIEFLECLAQVQALSNNNNNNKDTPATVIEGGGGGSIYNTHVYTSLISGLAHKGDATNAERLYNEMKHHGLRPTVATRVALAEAYGRAGEFDKALKLVGKRPKHAIMTCILSNAMRQERWELAHELAEKWMADKRIMNNTAADDKFRATLMWVKVKTGLDTAKSFFQRLYEEDPSFVNAVMVNHLVIESGNQRKKDQVYDSFGLHRQLENEPSPPLLSQHFYVDALFKCRDVPAALAAFVEMRRFGVPDDITMAMVVRGLVMNDEDNMAWNVFRIMRKNGLQPNLYAYSSILTAFAKRSQPPRWVSKELSKLWPNLHAAITGGHLEQPDMISNDLLGNPSHAYSLFQEMTGFQRPNEYTYTILIACFAKTSLARAADVFSHMCADGVKPTAQTYTAMLQGCAIFRNARMALVVFRHMREHHVTPNQKTWHYLLKALVRARVDRKKIDSVGRMARKAMDVS